MTNKQWYFSKTLWINAIAAVAIITQGVTGNMYLDAELQVAILAVINLILRLVTGQPIKWGK